MNSQEIDRLVYTYDTGGNRLTRVTDSAPTAFRSQGFLDGNTTGSDYIYDLNGNMTQDKNKGITQITYNHLNLPQKIVGTSQTIEYIYSANGQKLQKKAPNNEITRYSGNFIYEGTSLKQVLHSEGYIDMNGTPTYHYYLKDHLGNNRMVVNQSGTVVQQTDYYPFGMTFNKGGSSDNKYLYNGKELQEDAIGNGMLDWLDYGARMYDPSLGRFHTQDPALELYYDWTPYNYVGNNPIRRTDPTGMIWADTIAANDLKDAAQQRINQYEKSNSRLDKKMTKASEKGNDRRYSNLSERKGRNNTAINELETSIDQIDAMGADQNHTFEFQQVSGDGAHYVTQASNGNIVIQFSSTAIQLHETRHAFQYMTDKSNNWRWDSQGRLAPSGGFNSMVNWGLSEQSAYRVQYAYSSSSMPNSSFGSPSTIYDVTYKWAGGVNSIYQKFMPYMNQHEKIKMMHQKAARRKFFNTL